MLYHYITRFCYRKLKKNKKTNRKTDIFKVLPCLSDAMGDRYNIHSQLEHLQSKYIGTGHADTTKWEWVTNQHRDTYASYLVSATMAVPSSLRLSTVKPRNNGFEGTKHICLLLL